MKKLSVLLLTAFLAMSLFLTSCDTGLGGGSEEDKKVGSGTEEDKEDDKDSAFVYEAVNNN
jgi:predicted small secreted protein